MYAIPLERLQELVGVGRRKVIPWKEVMRELDLMPGQAVADIGAGSGFYTWLMSNAVGPDGVVWATDISSTALHVMQNHLNTAPYPNIRLLLTDVTDCLLPRRVWTRSCWPRPSISTTRVPSRATRRLLRRLCNSTARCGARSNLGARGFDRQSAERFRTVSGARRPVGEGTYRSDAAGRSGVRQQEAGRRSRPVWLSRFSGDDLQASIVGRPQRHKQLRGNSGIPNGLLDRPAAQAAVRGIQEFPNGLLDSRRSRVAVKWARSVALKGRGPRCRAPWRRARACRWRCAMSPSILSSV